MFPSQGVRGSKRWQLGLCKERNTNTRAKRQNMIFCPNPIHIEHKRVKGVGEGLFALLTVFSFTTWSLVGRSRAPHILRTSSRAWSCHCGCIARRMVVHVSRLDVVCLPAKKKLLHSSTMSSTVTLEELVLEA